MKDCTGFWFGMGAGMTAGLVLGMTAVSCRRSMKTQVGKRIRLYFDMDRAQVFDLETEENILYRKDW